MSERLIDLMARDLGIVRFVKESEDGFVCRVAYSALRFWIQAYCIDDGYGGAVGLSRDAVERKTVAWLQKLSEFYPCLNAWCGLAGSHGTSAGKRVESVSRYCATLIRLGDLIDDGEDSLRCTVKHTLDAHPGTSFIMGWFDPSETVSKSKPISGMMVAKELDHANHESDSATVVLHRDGMVDMRSLDTKHGILRTNTSLTRLAVGDKSWISALLWPVRSALDDMEFIYMRRYETILRHEFIRLGRVAC